MALLEHTDESISETISFVLPQKIATILKNSIVPSDELVDIFIKNNFVRIEYKSDKFVATLLEGRYPNYRSVIPQNNDKNLRIGVSEFKRAIKHVSIFSNQASSLVKLQLTNNQIMISGLDIDYSVAAEETITCDYSDSPITIGLNGHFLTELISSIPTPDLQISFSDPSKASLITPVDDKSTDKLTYINANDAKQLSHDKTRIRPICIRIEKLLSAFGDCIDYHFFPILKLFGEVTNFSGTTRNRVVNLQGEKTDAAYLTWQQASDPIKLELETLFSRAYSMTNTPQISFENLKGTGNALSGSAFRYVFMGAHMAVENHAEEIGLFMQRRVNFLISALGTQNSRLEAPAQTIDVEVEIIPYMIDNIDDKVQTAVTAVDGGIWSRKEGILFAGNVDRVDEELKEIEEDKQKAADRNNIVGMTMGRY